ncbi:MAG: phospholipid carrier-dependent glycosyltransferase [Candidatus Eremiobacteraeota bacterium]|nr:phospholipid carrier-dependent glycosyltransferase [Candidatus Eremiobacteraeota bacterium]
MSVSRANTASRLDSSPAMRSDYWKLAALLAVGFILRLIFMHDDGFKNDVASFEGWALTLAAHPLHDFYAKAGFADYPPGYFYVLWFIGHIYEPLKGMDSGFNLLRYLVKFPAVIMDLVVGTTIYHVVRRFADYRWALGAAALYLLNPATIFISASWGQIDSIAGGLGLIGLYLMLRSDDEDDRRATQFIVVAWLALAYSLLIKPQGALLVPLFLAFAFANPARRTMRLRAAAFGIAGSLVLAWLAALPFHPTANPVALFTWLFQRYQYGAGVYAVNSVNAFNLWTIRYSFWQPDNSIVLFFPQYLWGVLLLVAATVLILLRYLQAGTQRALLESAALLTLAFFILSTRMHERYVFDALLFSCPLVFAGRRYVVAALILSVTLFTNLLYSMQYMTVMDKHLPLDATNLWPLITRPMSLANVAVFFLLGYVFLGSSEQTESLSDRTAPALEDTTQDDVAARSWFDPREGLSTMRALDYLWAAGLGIISFVLSLVGYSRVSEKVFDEIYFARAAEEYLKHWYIYENTHPPLTKLLISLSVWMFGGLAHGDNAAGWRFLDVVFGALTVSLLYIFAKRITRSSLFSAIAAALLLFDGMHFAQSRIATPEAFVGFFSLATIYTFYRYWIASQVRTAQEVDGSQLRTRLLGTAACLALAILGIAIRFPNETVTAKFVGTIIAFAGLYLLFRGVILPRFFPSARTFIAYPDGTTVKWDGARQALHAPDGGSLDSAKGTVVAGDLSQNVRGALILSDGDLTSIYRKDGSLEYATPIATARYTEMGTTIEAEPVDFGKPKLWLALFALSITCLITSKWYGVMIYPAALGIIAWVWAQPYVSSFVRAYLGRRRHPARWGNPFGFPLDVVVSTLVFVGGLIYFSAYTPQFIGLSDQPTSAPRAYTFSDVVSMQQQMYDYHAHLVADHPYKSVWWQWPLDMRPIAYYWKDSRKPSEANNEAACCVSEITSLPNPLILWFGLFCVPFVGLLAYREKNKGYVLLVAAYLLQWLPWIRSPRISFAYHFYVDIALICLCNAIVLQRLWNWRSPSGSALVGRIVTGGYVAAVAGAFIFFYPLLAGVPMPWYEWHWRTLPWIMQNNWI